MYPKSLNREKFMDWLKDQKLPADMGATQISDDIIILRKIPDKNNSDLSEDNYLALYKFFNDNSFKITRMDCMRCKANDVIQSPNDDDRYICEMCGAEFIFEDDSGI